MILNYTLPVIVLSSVESCVSDICSWMRGNSLILNESKTEVVHFSSRYKKLQRLSHVRIGDALINPSDTVRDLGVLFDQYGTMKPHVNEVCRKASAALWRIGKIRSLLDQKTTERLIHAFVTSRLDYCKHVKK